MTRKTYTVSSGNVYRDLGFSDADERLAKAHLANRISALIARDGLTQQQAADILGVDQPKISALVSGNLAGFSMDRLLRFALALGYDVHLTLRRHRPFGTAGSMRVA
jgi:predicted XRE-type DNA-binding protein